ncbi:hypothetical protein HNR57_007129 [Streptomyces paradoxus]|uniref:Uncharacterized protein n=1 Tax=Streptomyces paradoxus TaxID=66375 RepID=A0A7W9TJS9_9ACTN|nr:hypothetical protein [Streptomyces paradoxus]
MAVLVLEGPAVEVDAAAAVLVVSTHSRLRERSSRPGESYLTSEILTLGRSGRAWSAATWREPIGSDEGALATDRPRGSDVAARRPRSRSRRQETAGGGVEAGKRCRKDPLAVVRSDVNARHDVSSVRECQSTPRAAQCPGQGSFTANYLTVRHVPNLGLSNTQSAPVVTPWSLSEVATEKGGSMFIHSRPLCWRP